MQTPKLFYKLILAITLLFAFIGQVSAITSINCEVAHANMAGYNTMDMTDHSMMDHSMQDSNVLAEHNDQSCCEVECNCPANACSFSSLFAINQISYVIYSNTEKIKHHNLISPLTQYTVLYRPPINA